MDKTINIPEPEILSSFALKGSVISCTPFGMGHINKTFLLETNEGVRYILQQINNNVFKNVPALMENVSAVCSFLAEKVSDPRECLHLVKTVDGADYLADEKGRFFRVYDYIEDSLCLEKAESPADFYESAVAFGRFQKLLGSFPAETLHETIPDFHHTPKRFLNFRRAVEADSFHRAEGVKREIDFYLSLEKEASILQDKRESGQLPLRVTHNDTKLNNVMFDSATRKALCIVDIDTVMPGLTAYDFGDSIRFGASTGAEDERDLDRVELDLELYRTYTDGFITTCDVLTDEEIKSLPFGAKLMTLENGIRFLTDYLEGDHYFSIAYPEHNLARSRTQLKLLQETERKWDQIERIFE